MDNRVPARQYKRRNGQTIYSAIDRQGEVLTEANCEGHIIFDTNEDNHLSAKYVGR